MSHQKRIDYKETAVNYYLVEDKTQEEVCKIFNCSRRSLMRWVKQCENEGKIKQGSDQRKTIYKISFKMGVFITCEMRKCVKYLYIIIYNIILTFLNPFFI
jgi:transposase